MNDSSETPWPAGDRPAAADLLGRIVRRARVERIRRAVSDGSYAVDPDRLAERLAEAERFGPEATGAGQGFRAVTSE